MAKKPTPTTHLKFGPGANNDRSDYLSSPRKERKPNPGGPMNDREGMIITRRGPIGENTEIVEVRPSDASLTTGRKK